MLAHMPVLRQFLLGGKDGKGGMLHVVPPLLRPAYLATARHAVRVIVNHGKGT